MKCRAMSRIYRNQPNAAQKKALYTVSDQRFFENLEKYNREAALIVLYILHFIFGFGQKRLKRFADKLSEMQDNIMRRYEADGEDIADICEIKLKDSGIDVERIIGE